VFIGLLKTRKTTNLLQRPHRPPIPIMMSSSLKNILISWKNQSAVPSNQLDYRYISVAPARKRELLSSIFCMKRKQLTTHQKEIDHTSKLCVYQARPHTFTLPSSERLQRLSLLYHRCTLASRGSFLAALGADITLGWTHFTTLRLNSDLMKRVKQTFRLCWDFFITVMIYIFPNILIRGVLSLSNSEKTNKPSLWSGP